MKTKHEKIVEVLKDLETNLRTSTHYSQDAKALEQSATAIEQLEPEGECSHCDGTGYSAENLDKSELIKCEHCSPPQQPSEDELAEIFANHADHTPYLNFDAFKAAIKELTKTKE